MPILPLVAFLQVAGVHPVGIGDRAPIEPIPGLDGKPAELGHEDTTVVTFFATWCEPCHMAIADLLAIRRRGPHFTLVLVAVAETPAHLASFIKTMPNDVVVGLDATATVARAWGQERFPTSFLVDKTWTIRHINRGYGRNFRDRIDRWLRGMQAPR